MSTTDGPSVPPFPPSFIDIDDLEIKRRCKSAWQHAHELIDAINRWFAWIEAARTHYDVAAGDAVVTQGRTALRVLRRLDTNWAALREFEEGQDDRDDILGWWPMLPSETFDKRHYVSEYPTEAQTEIDRLSMLDITRTSIRRWLELIAASPHEAMRIDPPPPKCRLTVDLKEPSAIYDGVHYPLTPEAASILDACAKNPDKGQALGKITSRPDRVRRDMPTPLADLFESHGGGGTVIPRSKLF